MSRLFLYLNPGAGFAGSAHDFSNENCILAAVSMEIAKSAI